MNRKLISFGLALLVTASAFGVNELVSYREFKHVALNAHDATESDDECQLRVKENDGGLVLSMRNEDKTASFFVAKDAKIRKTGHEEADGSYSFNYKVKEQGVLSVEHLDDAYFHVTLKSYRNGVTTNCDIDF